MSSVPSILLADPDVSLAELEAVENVLKSPRLSAGPMVEAFETTFAQYVGRKHAVAVSSATLGLMLSLRAYGIGSGDEVVAPPFGFRETLHGITLAGAVPVFADIDYWSCTLAPEKASAGITDKTRAIVACNANGHPAMWAPLRELASKHGLLLIEDSSEAIGSRYQGQRVGTFGDCSIFDLSQPGALTAGEGGMVVTDDSEFARKLKAHRSRRPEERHSVVLGEFPPYRAEMSELNAALGLIQLQRLDDILERRKLVEAYYDGHMQSLEGIKPAYMAPEVEDLHWMVYLVHLGTRFTRSSRDAILQDLSTEQIEAVAFCQPLHLQSHYTALGYRKGDFFVTEKLADRAIALPFHGHLTEDQIGFVVKTAKDASINVGAGAAIYL